MTHLPRFSKLDTNQVLRRAMEIEGWTMLLQSIAGEADFGSQTVERAIAEVQ